jgi:predicted nucleotidyltransferase component of viral defense system
VKTSTQLKAKIRNMAQQKNIKPEVILRNYMMERFLERMANSKYADKFILKGGLLIVSMVGIDTRSTMDLDATMKGQSISKEKLEKIVNEILCIEVEDNVEMSLLDISNIHDESDYPGFRVSIATKFDKTKQTIKIDVTSGDVITPKEITYTFPLMFEEREIQIQAYNLETVLAEKLESVMDRNTTNTRMRDFYDIHILTTMHGENIDYAVFANAFKRTSEKRGSIERIGKKVMNIFDMIEKSGDLALLWDKYQKKYPYAADIAYTEVIEDIRKLIGKTGL